MGNLVICLFLVKAYECTIYFVDVTGVDHKLCEVHLVFYVVLFHEAGLVWVDKVGGDSSQAVGEDADTSCCGMRVQSTLNKRCRKV